VGVSDHRGAVGGRPQVRLRRRARRVGAPVWGEAACLVWSCRPRLEVPLEKRLGPAVGLRQPTARAAPGPAAAVGRRRASLRGRGAPATGMGCWRRGPRPRAPPAAA
jgi:hypothetical protein